MPCTLMTASGSNKYDFSRLKLQEKTLQILPDRYRRNRGNIVTIIRWFIALSYVRFADALRFNKSSLAFLAHFVALYNSVAKCEVNVIFLRLP